MITIVGAIITNQDGHILLIHRNAKRVHWEIPGGKLEQGETEQGAVMREIKEELGVESRVIRKIGEKQFTEDGREIMHIWLSLIHI